MKLKSPYVYFGGKSTVADVIWDRFGSVDNYVEPFLGSAAVMLRCPYIPKVETANDLDCMVANFWRALAADPNAVAEGCDWPVNEADLHARHLWLVRRKAELREQIYNNADYYDAKAAGWWVWGINLWIGGGWCETKDALTVSAQVRDFSGNGHGVARKSLVDERRPHLNGGSAVGVHRPRLAEVQDKLPQVSGGSLGCHRPHLGRPSGTNGKPALYGYLAQLSARMRRVRVCCGDFERVLTPAVTTFHGLTAVLLDPPYSLAANRDMGIYAEDCGEVAVRARNWAVEHGDDPQFRIAMCGYEGEHEMPESWSVHAWKTQGGYGNKADESGKLNRHKERIWFSPHCLKTELF